MKTLCIFFVIAIFSSQALGFRLKRQVTEGEDLEDRYGWDRPWQMQFPSQNRFPGQLPAQFPGFPNQGQFPLFPGPGQFPGFPGGQTEQQRLTTPPTPATQSTTSADDAAAIAACIRQCPVTSEYNPVCGTNNVDYDNPGRLECARACGTNVTLLRTSRCPPPTPAP